MFSLSASGSPKALGNTLPGPRLIHKEERHVDSPPGVCFGVVERLGGQGDGSGSTGCGGLRGSLDVMVGGVGMRRGRPPRRSLAVGDALDFWRVEASGPPRQLRLFAEMKLPGRAWLEFAVEPDGPGSRITQTAMFDPVGILGRVYWYGVYPLHRLVFRGMLDAIAARAAA